MASALALLLITTFAGCGLDSPTSSENATDLTGQNPNAQFTFTGTVTISISSGTLVGDDASTIVITAEVRDANGNPIANLTAVVFSADLGGFDLGDPTVPVTQVATATTFNGIAQVLYRSASSGNATVTASVGSVNASANVTVEPDPERGSIQLFFLVEGQQLTTTSGSASNAAPFVRELNTVVIDPDTGTFQQGAQIEFRIIKDTTGGKGTDPATFVGPRKSFTDQFGKAVAQLRVVGVGDVVVIAEMIDSNTGDVAGTSNQVIAITGAAFIANLTFSDGVSTSFTGGAPYTEGITVTVTNTSLDAVPGVTVRLRIVADSTTAGASLSSSLVVTNANGKATTTLTVPDNAAAAGSSVTIIAEVVDGNNNVLATSNTIVAIGT